MAFTVVFAIPQRALVVSQAVDPTCAQLSLSHSCHWLQSFIGSVPPPWVADPISAFSSINVGHLVCSNRLSALWHIWED